MLDEPTNSGTALDVKRDLASVCGAEAVDVPKIGDDCAADGFGAILPGYPVKRSNIDPAGDFSFSLIDKTKIVVIDCISAFERRTPQIPHNFDPATARIRTKVDFNLHGPEIVAIPHAAQRHYIIDPVANT